jgi:hypothetical protein
MKWHHSGSSTAPAPVRLRTSKGVGSAGGSGHELDGTDVGEHGVEGFGPGPVGGQVQGEFRDTRSALIVGSNRRQ